MAQLWGGRFTKETDKLVYNFNASISFDKRFYEQDIQGSKAHVMMLAKQGILTDDEKQQILDGLESIRRDVESGKLEITEEYEDIQNISVQKGRYILDVDNDNRLQVCLIGVTAAKDLFGHTDVEGETIRISGRNFKIIGVLEEDGSSQRDSNDSVIYTPFTTAQRIMQNSTISSFYVSATNEGMLNMAESAVDSFLLEKTGDEDSYTITNQSDIADSVSDVTNSMTYMIGGIAGISLLVGGIGIMNIMLVSVTERTKEIGIRKAIGAKKKDILAQFMIESTVLSCMGGVIGIALSAATIFGMNQLMSADYTISAGISLIALAFSAILGIVFGLYPANKAANLKPIEALNL